MGATLRNYIVEQAWVQPYVTILVEQALGATLRNYTC